MPTSPFKVSSLAELRSFHARIVEKTIPIKFVFNHGASFAFYFTDPDGNLIEVYWPTGSWRLKQPQAFPLDLSLPDDVLLQELAMEA
jgi:catechol-2,3-dioxygenase